MLSVAPVYALPQVSQIKESDMSNTATVRQHAINWFEIPCADLDRATTFYETLLGAKMQRENIGDNNIGDNMAIFPV